PFPPPQPPPTSPLFPYTTLFRSRDNAVVDDMSLKVVTQRAPTAEELADLKFAFRVAKHVKSNAIVYARNGATVGIGAGQMSRVEDRKSTRLNSSHVKISYAVFCL